MAFARSRVAKKKGITARLRASRKRKQQAADALVYAAVDARDGLRSRLSGEYCGIEVHRHHIVFRSQGGKTTTQNVISLTANEHLVGCHGGHLRLTGNADTKDARGVFCGVTVERMTDAGWQTVRTL